VVEPQTAVGSNDVRSVVFQLLDEYEAAGGRGADDYAAEPLLHPMAEGKHLLTLATLRRAGLIGAVDLRRRAQAGLERLRATSLARPRGGVAWGLGFPFRTAPADEPYVITSAIVTAGLAALFGEVKGAQLSATEELLAGALRWLTAGVPRTRRDGHWVPVYSPTLRFPVNNVTAYWSGVVTDCQRLSVPVPRPTCDPQKAASAVLDRWSAAIGWRYDDTSRRVDLLHTCYIGAGLIRALPAESERIDRLLLSAVSQFRGPDGWYDRFDAEPFEELLARPAAWRDRTVRVLGAVAQVGFDRPARAWSVGEMLVLAAERSAAPVVGPVWEAHLRPLWTMAVHEHVPAPSFRHSMHLAHGLASALAAVRAARGRAARSGA
jgi:hypothetical protein